MSAPRETAVTEYRNARALMADALRRDDQNAKEAAHPIYLAALARLKAEETTND